MGLLIVVKSASMDRTIETYGYSPTSQRSFLLQSGLPKRDLPFYPQAKSDVRI